MSDRGTKFVYYKNLITGRTDEMNAWEWEMIQKDPDKKKNFEFVREVDTATFGTAVIAQSVPKDVPVVADELSCPLCDFVASTERGLRTHKGKKHGTPEPSV